MPRLMLVEAFLTSKFENMKALMYPFIAGYLRQLGVAVEWVWLPRDDQPRTSHSYLFDLDASTRRRLVERAEHVEATHLLLSERPHRRLSAHLSQALPTVIIADLGTREPCERSAHASWLAQWLGLPGEHDGLLPDLCDPAYEAQGLLDARAGRPGPVTVTAGTHCLYAAPLAGNPHFAGVDLGLAGRAFGCSFCTSHPDLRYPYQTPPLDLVMRQIRAATAANRERTYSISSAAAFRQVEQLLERFAEVGQPPSQLYFSCRADELLRAAERFERALPRARDLGHQVHIWNLGVESFSPAENERLNKRISYADIVAVKELTSDWERRFPEHFFFNAHGGFGFILFTPWTSWEDLSLNLEAARELDLPASFLLTRRIALLPGSAARLAAERDGLLAADDPQTRASFEWLVEHCDPGCLFWADDDDVPWRFRHPRVGAICAIAVRMAGPRVAAPSDPYQPRILEAISRFDEHELLDLFDKLLECARPPDGPDTVDELLAAFEERLAREVRPEPVEQAPTEPPLMGLYRTVFHELARQPGDPLRGFRLVELDVEERRVSLVFAGEEGPLRVFVTPHEPGSSYLLRRGNLLFSHDESTPIASPASREVFRQVVRVFSRGARPAHAQALQAYHGPDEG